MTCKKIGFGALTITMMLAAGAAMGQTTAADSSGGMMTATANLQDAQGNSVGEVTLTQYNNGVILHGELTGLPAGWHGIHVHQTGKCSPDFKAAGDHFNPNDTQHGLDGGEPHAGDLANIRADDNGDAQFELMTDRFSLGAPEVAATEEAGDVGAMAAAPSIFDDDGAALVIHAQPDDYMTEPSGDSGDRIACGVIEQG